MQTSLHNLLKQVDTPTVCNAIEVAQGKRGFNDFTRGTMLCSEPGQMMVGYARTAKIAALQPSTDSVDIVRQRRMAYYKYMAEGTQPAIAVIEDIDFPDCIGAYWGEVNTKIHQGFGMVGTLTNGVMRDLDDMAEGYPVVAGSIGPSHGFVHVTDIDCPVQVFHMEVVPGQLIHADQHGAVTIPESVIDDLEQAIHTLFKNERLVLDRAEQPGFNFAAFEKAWTAFEKART